MIFLIAFMFQVPHTTFLLTHACFLFYHMASNMTLRRLRHSTAHLPQSIRWLFEAAWILALSYFIAYLETLAIANVCSSLYLTSTFQFYYNQFSFCIDSLKNQCLITLNSLMFTPICSSNVAYPLFSSLGICKLVLMLTCWTWQTFQGIQTYLVINTCRQSIVFRTRYLNKSCGGAIGCNLLHNMLHSILFCESNVLVSFDHCHTPRKLENYRTTVLGVLS